MEYEQLLDELYKKIPEKKGSAERLEVPAPDVLVEGNKTVVKNFGQICESIRRSAKEVSKYLFKELATPGAVQEDRLILQRKLHQRLINEKLSSYVENYVVCRECKRPDTHITEQARNIRQLVCEACGASYPVRA